MFSFSLPRILFIVLLFSSTQLLSQRELEVGFGYGKSELSSYGFNWFGPYTNDGLHNSSLYGTYYVAPKEDPHFRFHFGLRTNYYTHPKYKFGIIKIPLGLGFKFGQKVNFILDAGIDNGILVYLNTNNSDFNETKTNYLLGAYIDPGLSVPLFETNYKLVMRYRLGFNSSKIYEEQSHSPGGAKYYRSVQLSEHFISIGLRISL